MRFVRHVYGWVQFSVYSDTELGRHYGKEEYVCKGLIIKENFRRQYFQGCGVVKVLVSTICVCPELLSCITGLDVMDKNIFYGGTDGLACVQEDPVWFNDIYGWCFLCSLGHVKSHL